MSPDRVAEQKEASMASTELSAVEKAVELVFDTAKNVILGLYRAVRAVVKEVISHL